MIKKDILGKVVHSRKVEGLQTDSFTTSIPLDFLSADGVKLLSHWCVEEFDRAYVDWENGEIVLVYKTEHWLPEGYVPEEVG